MSVTRRQFLINLLGTAVVVTTGAALTDGLPLDQWRWSGWYADPYRPVHVGFWYWALPDGTLAIECEAIVEERDMIGMTRVQRLLHMDRVKHEAYAGRHRGWYRDGRTGRLA